MPACTALGVKSSSSEASWSGRSVPVVVPQPAVSAAAASRRQSATRTLGIVPTLDAPSRHLLAQRHALAVAYVPVPLQVLRLRDASAAPARARGGRAADRRRRPPPGQGAARPHRRGARPPAGG